MFLKKLFFLPKSTNQFDGKLLHFMLFIGTETTKDNDEDGYDQSIAR